jgi:hypothetical protein
MQQSTVLERRVTRPQSKQGDRQILMMLASRIRGWKPALVVVKPSMGFRDRENSPG